MINKSIFTRIAYITFTVSMVCDFFFLLVNLGLNIHVKIFKKIYFKTKFGKHTT